MIVLINLDGTLVNTVHTKFEKMRKEGNDIDISLIPIFDGAVEFVRNHDCIIVSNSHPEYVNKIGKEIFSIDVGFSIVARSGMKDVVYSANKPNIRKTYDTLEEIAEELDPDVPFISIKEDLKHFIMIGDSWIDIELGRRLNIQTILTRFYKPSIEQQIEEKWYWKFTGEKSTYYAKNFEELERIMALLKTLEMCSYPPYLGRL